MQLKNAIYSKFYLIIFESHELLYRFTRNSNCDFKHTLNLRRFGGCLGVEGWWKRAIKAIHSKPDFLSLNLLPNLFCSFADQRQGWVPTYQGCHHEEASEFGNENDPTLTRHRATFNEVTHTFFRTDLFTKPKDTHRTFSHPPTLERPPSPRSSESAVRPSHAPSHHHQPAGNPRVETQGARFFP